MYPTSMRTLRLIFLLFAAGEMAACKEYPISSLPNGNAQFASVGAPRFTEASASGPSATGSLLVSFKMAGLGSKASNVVNVLADGTAFWACRIGTGEFDGWPLQSISGPLNSTSAPALKNGQLAGSATLNPPAAAQPCAAGGHTATLISTGYTSVQVTHTDDGSLAIPGAFDRVFFTLPEETLPVITALNLAATTFVISGAGVNYDVTIENPGGSLSDLSVQAWIRQGTAFRAAGGTILTCTVSPGDLPPGSCVVSSSASANNDPAAGSGTLIPGPAVLEIVLRTNPSIRVLAGWRADITLTSP